MTTVPPAISEKLRWLAVVFVVLLGGWLRVEAALQTEIHAPVRADAAQYLLYAYNLKFFDVYSRGESGLTSGETPKPDAFRSPGYPMVLMPLMQREPTTGTLLQITVIQALVSTGLLVFIFMIGRKVLPFGYALAVTALTAFSPHLINANLYLLTEGLFALCMVAVLGALLHDANKPWGTAVLLGLVIGYGALVRPSLQYFIVPAAALLLWHFRRPEGIRAAIVAVLAFALVYSPWLIRNELQFGFTSDETLKIATLHHGMYPDFRYQNRPETFGFPYRHDPTMKLSSSMSEVLTEIGRRFTEEPGRHLQWFLFGKPVMLWSWDIVQGQGDAFVYEAVKTPYATDPLFTTTHSLMKLLHWPLVVLAFAGSLAVWLYPGRLGLQRSGLLIARMGSLLILYFTALHMVGAPFPRYSIPLRPVMYLMALVALAPAIVYIRQRISGRILPQLESRP